MKHQSITINTIRDFIEHDYEIWACCGDLKCNHSAQLDLNYLAKKFGMDFEPMAQAINPRLRCSKCGKKNATIRISPAETRRAKGSYPEP